MSSIENFSVEKQSKPEWLAVSLAWAFGTEKTNDKLEQTLIAKADLEAAPFVGTNIQGASRCCRRTSPKLRITAGTLPAGNHNRRWFCTQLTHSSPGSPSLWKR